MAPPTPKTKHSRVEFDYDKIPAKPAVEPPLPSSEAAQNHVPNPYLNSQLMHEKIKNEKNAKQEFDKRVKESKRMAIEENILADETYLRTEVRKEDARMRLEQLLEEDRMEVLERQEARGQQ